MTSTETTTGQVDVKPTTCTINEAALSSLLSDLSKTTSDDPILISLHGVLLHTADHDGTPVLVATSSNRYVAAQEHLPCSGELPSAVFLSLPHVNAIEQHLANSRSEFGSSVCQECGVREDCTRCDRDDYVPPRMVELAVSPNGARLATRVIPAGGARNEGVTITVPVEKFGTLPARVFDLLGAPDTAEPVAGPVVLAPESLRALTAIPSRGESFHLTGFGPDKPVLVQVGQNYRAVVMPKRDDCALSPVFGLPSAP
ncbi:MAG TPA: hypothetical protein VGJ13_04925 [Pseudonocardiaceae bacterium]